MSNFKAKIHFDFADPLTTFKGPTYTGREGAEARGKEEKVKGWEVPPALLVPPDVRC